MFSKEVIPKSDSFHLENHLKQSVKAYRYEAFDFNYSLDDIILKELSSNRLLTCSVCSQCDPETDVQTKTSEIKIWDTVTKKLIVTLPGNDKVHQLMVLPNGNLIVAIDDYLVLWDMESYQLIKKFRCEGLRAEGTFFKVLSKGKFVCVNRWNRVSIWDFANENAQISSFVVPCLSFKMTEGENDTLITLDDSSDEFKVWNIHTWNLIKSITCPITDFEECAFLVLPNNQLFIVCDNKIYILNNEGKIINGPYKIDSEAIPIKDMQGIQLLLLENGCVAIFLNHSYMVLSSIEKEHYICVFDTVNKKLVWKENLDGFVQSFDVLPSGQLVTTVFKGPGNVDMNAFDIKTGAKEKIDQCSSRYNESKLITLANGLFVLAEKGELHFYEFDYFKKYKKILDDELPCSITKELKEIMGNYASYPPNLFFKFKNKFSRMREDKSDQKMNSKRLKLSTRIEI